MNYFVTAIGTDSGKTLVSAILVECLQADYWKPVQAGHPRDTETVQRLISNGRSRLFEETYRLNTPASPHASAKIDNVRIDLDNLRLPVSNRHLVIEGAGGMMVPLNDKDLVIDIADRPDIEIILVSNLYLGSINHTLLSVDYLKRRKLAVRGIIFNGEPNAESEKIILEKSEWPCLLRVLPEKNINKKTILKYAEKISKSWNV